MKYACIARLAEEFDVRLMCRLLDVSASGFYAAVARQHQALGPRARANQRLTHEIRAAHTASHYRYGAPKIHATLTAQGVACGRHRVARLMRRAGLRGICPRAFRVTTQSGDAAPVAANLLARRFAPSAYTARDQVWVADLTYLWTDEGWLYLAVVLDLASRRVIGWCADRGLDHSLPLRALERALAVRQPGAGLIHHSDRGVQYASAAYQATLRAHGITSSMSRVGNCWDNAVAESFFATLKTELVAAVHWATRDAAQRDLATFIESWYNYHRRHGSLGYRSPVHYERELTRVRSA